LERAGGARRGAGCRPHTWCAHREADQCRIPKCVFDATCEHHDAGTLDRIGFAPDCAFDGQPCRGVPAARRTDVTDGTGITDSRSRQETADAKTRAHSDTCAGHISGTSCVGAFSFLGMIPC
jgi:hypothetical protein